MRTAILITIALASVWVLFVLALLWARPDGMSMRELAKILPDTVRLIRRLAGDQSLSRRDRTFLWLLVAYLLLPFDLVPDFLPVIGVADDVILIAVVLRHIARRAGPESRRRHWPGTPDGLATLERALRLPVSSTNVGNAGHDDDMHMRARIQRANDATYAAWNAHDPDAVAALFAADAEIVDVVSGAVTRGRAAIRATTLERFTGFPDFSLEKVFLVIDTDAPIPANADRWIMRGTHTGEFMGLEPTGRAVEVSGATFSEFDADGLVARDTHYIDLAALLRQLGLD